MSAFEFRAADVSRDSELLRGLEPSEIDVILAAARPRQFSARSVITHQDDPGKRLFLLWKGRARHFYETLHGEKQILMWITPGLIFGGTSLAVPPPLIWSAQKRCGTALCSFGMAQPFAT